MASVQKIFAIFTKRFQISGYEIRNYRDLPIPKVKLEYAMQIKDSTIVVTKIGKFLTKFAKKNRYFAVKGPKQNSLVEQSYRKCPFSFFFFLRLFLGKIII